MTSCKQIYSRAYITVRVNDNKQFYKIGHVFVLLVFYAARVKFSSFLRFVGYLFIYTKFFVQFHIILQSSKLDIPQYSFTVLSYHSNSINTFFPFVLTSFLFLVTFPSTITQIVTRLEAPEKWINGKAWELLDVKLKQV